VEANEVKDANNEDGDDDNSTISQIPSAVFATKIHQRRQRRKGKHKNDRKEIKAKVKAMPFSKRRCTRMLAAQLETPESAIMCIFKQHGSIFKRHTNSLKPKLAEDDQRATLQFA